MSYKAMFIATKYLLKNKINVIIDAALYSNKLVKEAKKLSNKSKVIQVICPEKLVKERLQRRVKKSGQKYSA
jgi:dephospho-CoA kinase